MERVSNRVERGETIGNTQLPSELSVEYFFHLRFPLLYQGLVDAGAIALAIPAAFTFTTGRAHWHTLLRARAIECQSYVIAPAQYGKHDIGNRHSFGHALIYDPWGELLAECTADEANFAIAEIDPELVSRSAHNCQCLRHRQTLLMTDSPAETIGHSYHMIVVFCSLKRCRSARVRCCRYLILHREYRYAG